MNFFQFLKNNDSTSPKLEESKNNENVRSNFIEGSQVTSPKLDDSKNNKVIEKQYHSSVLKPGNRIKIIYYPNSYYNSYKGYYGEIKDYKKSQSFALVHIFTSTSTRKISLPIDHFIKI